MLEKLKSRKFLVTLFTQILVVIVVALFDLPEEQATTIVAGVVGSASAYVLGQGYADGQDAAASPPAASEE